MAKHHIIPRFILRNFSLNPDADKQDQEIRIFDVKTNRDYVSKIKDAYEKENFNSEKVEKKLCEEYENKIANLFKRIKNVADNNGPFVSFNNEEYKLLFKFFTIMWRRNSKHIDDFKNKILPLAGNDYKNIFVQNEEFLTKMFYEHLIETTTDDDETVQKTISNYELAIVENTSDVNFLLHNTYGTLCYFKREGEEIVFDDYPFLQLFPISKKLYFYLTLTNSEIDVESEIFQVPIDKCYDKDEIIEIFIRKYIQPNALSYIVDETNIEFVKR